MKIVRYECLIRLVGTALHAQFAILVAVTPRRATIADQNWLVTGGLLCLRAPATVEDRILRVLEWQAVRSRCDG